MKIDRKTLKKVVKVILHKVPKEEEEKLLKIVDNLELLQTLYRKDKDFRNFLLNPKIPADQKAKFIEKFSEKANFDNIVIEAIKYLAKINRINLLKVLASEFRFEVEKFFATVKGEIITAFPLQDDDVKEIKDIVERKIGKKVEFEVKEDQSLIGGVIVKAGSYILDASVKSYLKKFAYKLTNL